MEKEISQKKWDFLLHIKGKKVSRQDKLEAGWEVISQQMGWNWRLPKQKGFAQFLEVDMSRQ